jgi:hypothetical protein
VTVQTNFSFSTSLYDMPWTLYAPWFDHHGKINPSGDECKVCEALLGAVLPVFLQLPFTSVLIFFLMYPGTPSASKMFVLWLQ